VHLLHNAADVAGELLRAVDGDRVAVVDQVAAKRLAAQQPLYQRDVRRFDVCQRRPETVVIQPE